MFPIAAAFVETDTQAGHLLRLVRGDRNLFDVVLRRPTARRPNLEDTERNWQSY